MTEAKHTPGPWALNKYGEPVDATGENIRAKGLALTNSDEAKANTQLIVAAPELLEQCQLFERVIQYQIKVARSKGDDEGANHQTLTLNLLQDVLAKAGS